MSRRVETWQLRAKFASALSRMYGAEVPAYTTLLKVSAEVNRELGGSDRVTAERHGAIRVGNPRELAHAADLFAAFGMYPSKPVVYEDFLPASAAGIFRSNLDTDAQKTAGEEDRDNPVYNADWMAGQIGHHIHDPYELYEKVASS